MTIMSNSTHLPIADYIMYSILHKLLKRQYLMILYWETFLMF